MPPLLLPELPPELLPEELPELPPELLPPPLDPGWYPAEHAPLARTRPALLVRAKAIKHDFTRSMVKTSL